MKVNGYYKDKVVLITGASMGIGKELARQVLMAGGKVFLTARNNVRLQNTILEFKEYNKSIYGMSCDASDHTSNLKLIEEVIRVFGKLDVLITNAGMSCYGEIDKLEAEVAKQIIDINIYGSLFPVMAAINELKKSEGSITFISSIAGLSGIPGYSSYSLSKMALTALAQSLSIEMKPYNVNVHIAYFGFTENENTKRTLSPNGGEEKVPDRPKLLTASRAQTASKILKQTSDGKFSKAYSITGKLTDVISRHLPSLAKFSIQINYLKKLKLD